MNTENLEKTIAKCLDEFYRRRIEKLSGLKLRHALARKNPYLFRAIGTESADEIVRQLLDAFTSSSDEGIFGDAFFEPLAKEVSGGVFAPSAGTDIAIETDKTYLAIAVKSGPSVFNAQSKKRQDQDFKELRSRMLKLQKQFEALVGYCYGRRDSPPTGTKIFHELAGQSFWAKLTGEHDFYLKIIELMRNKPLEHKKKYVEEKTKAVNRFLKEFMADFCADDGSIDWPKLVRFNSGEERPKAVKKNDLHTDHS